MGHKIKHTLNNKWVFLCKEKNQQKHDENIFSIISNMIFMQCAEILNCRLAFRKSNFAAKSHTNRWVLDSCLSLSKQILTWPTNPWLHQALKSLHYAHHVPHFLNQYVTEEVLFRFHSFFNVSWNLEFEVRKRFPRRKKRSTMLQGLESSPFGYSIQWTQPFGERTPHSQDSRTLSLWSESYVHSV